MPEFHIDLGCDTDRWCGLDAFTQGYIECMFFTESGEEDSPLANATFASVAQSTLDEIKADCEQFKKEAGARLDTIEASQAGHDFWLTRNHHGAGFWDRDLGELGQELTAIADNFGTVDAYVGDDETVYVT